MGSQDQKGLSRWTPRPPPCSMAEGEGSLHPAWPTRARQGTLALGVLAGGRPLSLTDTAECGMSQQSFGLQVMRGPNNQSPSLPQKEQEAVDSGSTPWARLCCSPGLSLGVKVGHVQGRKREKRGHSHPPAPSLRKAGFPWKRP